MAGYPALMRRHRCCHLHGDRPFKSQGLAATGVGYAALGKTVKLSVDGKTTQVHTFGDKVSDVLAAKGISVGQHDEVAPGVGSSISDGQSVSVRFGRPLEVKVDGRAKKGW